MSNSNSGCTSTSRSSASTSDTIATSARSWCSRPTGSDWKPDTISMLDLRPALAERVHRRHQPVEAGMAFDGDAQLAAAALRRRAMSRSACSTCRQHRLRPVRSRRRPAGVNATGADLRSNSVSAVELFQRLELVRQRGLGHVQQTGGARQAARLKKGQQGAQMAQFEDRGRHDEFICDQKKFRLNYGAAHR